MTRVRMLRRIGGLRDGAEWPAVGGEIDLPDWEAQAVISAGDARLVEIEASALLADGSGLPASTGVSTDLEDGSVDTPPSPRRRRSKA